MKSIVEYENRGKWGNNQWRGNTSGHLIVDLCNHFSPRSFVDICEGSGTSRDVCKELNISYTGMDLHSGFDFTSDSVLKRVGKESDLVFSHPPYHNMIKYSGNMWGDRPNERDTSNCINAEEFIEKSQLMLLNQREATKTGKNYCTLIGDMRSKETGFRSFQSDFIKLMPSNELKSVVVKIQNNSKSFFKSYKGSFIPIMHEYLLIWEKKSASLFQVTLNKALETKKEIASTWKNAIRMTFISKGKNLSLSDIYDEVEKVAQHLIKNNKHWKAKVRQVLQVHFINVQRGIWTA